MKTQYKIDLDLEAKKLGAIEKREYLSYNTCFTFYILGPKRNGYYPIYRRRNCINGPCPWESTVGNAEWVEQSRVIEVFNADN